jgi:hypothetical protein
VFIARNLTGHKKCTISLQFITVNNLYMFRALICSSSGGAVCTQNIPIPVYAVPPDDEQISVGNL